jgi:hypothetical protein
MNTSMLPLSIYPSVKATCASLSSFTQFSLLPVEIRLTIWNLSLQPRTVEIKYVPDSGFRSRVWEPATLRTCREARDAVIKLYPLCFGSFFHPKMTRVNFALDSIYMDRHMEDDMPHFFSTFGELEIAGLRYLAITSSIMRRYSWIEEGSQASTRRAVAALTGLKELIGVFEVRHCAPNSHVPHPQLWFGQGPMELFDELPEVLKHSWLNVKALPCPYGTEDSPGAAEFYDWEAPQFRAVYGWRPVNMDHFYTPR